MKTLRPVLQISYVDRIRNYDIYSHYEQINVTHLSNVEFGSILAMFFECLKAGTLLLLFLMKLPMEETERWREAYV